MRVSAGVSHSNLKRILIVALSLVMVVLLSIKLSLLAFASTSIVSRKVSSSAGTGIAGVYVYATLPGESTVKYGPAVTNSLGNYSLTLGSTGTYDVHYEPPMSSGYSNIVNSNLVVSGNLTQNVTVTNETRTFSGILTDEDNVAIPGATVRLINGSAYYQTTTTSAGEYNISVPAGKYMLYLSGSMSGISSFTLSQSYASSLNLTFSDLVLDLKIKTVDVSVTVFNNAGQQNWGVGEKVYARSTNGTTFLYPGDPGTNITLSFSNGFSASSSATGTIRTISGAYFTPLGLESTSYTTSICKTLSGKTGVYDCINLPYTALNNDSMDLPENQPLQRVFGGVLLDSSNNPVPGVEITLYKYGDSSPKATTNSLGEFTINALPKKYSLKLQKNTPYAGISSFTLTQNSIAPNIDLTQLDGDKSLQLNNTTMTVTAYNRSGNVNFLSDSIIARSTSGTAYLYPGDPGSSVLVNSDSHSLSGGSTGVLGTIVGASYTALGLNSSQWVGSVCIQLSTKFDCLTNPVTVTSPMTFDVPY